MSKKTKLPETTAPLGDKSVAELKRYRVCRADQDQKAKQSAPVDDFAETAKKLAKHPKMAKVIEARKARAEKTVAELTKSVSADLSIPPFLDRIEGRSKEEIEAERDRLIEQHKKRDQAQRKIIATKPKESANLNDADRKAIAELQADADNKAKAKKQAGLEQLKKLNAEKKAHKAEIAAIKKAAKEANGKNDHGDEAEVNAAPKSKKSAKGKASAEPKAKKSARKPKVAKEEKANAVFGMLKRKNGASNAEMVEQLGFRWNVGPMKALCKERGYKLNIKKEEGEPLRYVATN